MCWYLYAVDTADGICNLRPSPCCSLSLSLHSVASSRSDRTRHRFLFSPHVVRSPLSSQPSWPAIRLMALRRLTRPISLPPRRCARPSPLRSTRSLSHPWQTSSWPSRMQQLIPSKLSTSKKPQRRPPNPPPRHPLPLPLPATIATTLSIFFPRRRSRAARARRSNLRLRRPSRTSPAPRTPITFLTTPTRFLLHFFFVACLFLLGVCVRCSRCVTQQQLCDSTGAARVLVHMFSCTCAYVLADTRIFSSIHPRLYTSKPKPNALNPNPEFRSTKLRGRALVDHPLPLFGGVVMQHLKP